MSGRALSRELRRRRVARGFSLSELARTAGVSASTLSRWESGQSLPDAEPLRMVLDALAVPLEQRHAIFAAIPRPRMLRLARDLDEHLGLCEPGGGIVEPTAGDLLRAARGRRRMPAERLAARLGVTAAAVSQWENGRRWPDIGTLDAIAVALRLNPLEAIVLKTRRFEIDGLRKPEEVEARLETLLRGRVDWRMLDLEYGALEVAAWRVVRQDSACRHLLGRAYLAHARALLDTGRLSEVPPLTRAACEVVGDLDLPEFLAMADTFLVVGFTQRGQYARALNLLDDILRLRLPPRAKCLPHVLAIDVHSVLGDHRSVDDAADRAQDVASLDQGALETVRLHRADAYTNLGAPEVAMEHMPPVHQLDGPQSVFWHHARCAALLSIGQVDDALCVLRQCRQVETDYAMDYSVFDRHYPAAHSRFVALRSLLSDEERVVEQST